MQGLVLHKLLQYLYANVNALSYLFRLLFLFLIRCGGVGLLGFRSLKLLLLLDILQVLHISYHDVKVVPFSQVEVEIFGGNSLPDSENLSQELVRQRILLSQVIEQFINELLLLGVENL